MPNDLLRLLREAAIERLTSDSRRAAPGSAFFAWPGGGTDGRRFIAQAIERGCGAVVWESDGFAWDAALERARRVPNAPVKNLRARAGEIASAFHGRPSEAMWVCGVTGTNGKTSCSQWLAHALAARGTKTGVIGTIGSGFPPALAPVANTTPDALELQALLAGFRAAGAGAVAMEVSSHGLEQGRVNGVAFDCALLTNLTHDHLDYHGTMAAYAAAKARLFDAPGLAAAVLNLDDAFGAGLAQQLGARGLRVIGYGFSRPALDEFVCIENFQSNRVRIDSTWGTASAVLPQVGKFSAANALGVLGCLVAHGISFAEGVALLERLPAVPGRMQTIGDRPLVIVDYAHSPDALDKVLAALQPVAQARGGRLVAVFGAGGGRDAAKRPQMGLAAARRADRIVLTSDNPRGEDPLAIIAAIRSGIAGKMSGGSCVVESDRARAIEGAIAEAGAADVVLIAGKGHEDTQEIAGRKLPFSDAAAARAALARRGAQ